MNIADYTVKQSHASWLENVRITGNLNEFTINKASDPFGRAAFFPKYNISASISLGTFFTTPYTIKKSKEAKVIAQANVNAQKLAVRNEVLKLYNEYLMRERIFKLQTQALLDN